MKKAAICKVEWCACLPAKGSTVCVVHKANPDLHPMPLAADEELVDGAAGDECEACEGTGRCKHCDGDGDAEYRCECGCGKSVSRDCHACDSFGECEDCEGRGTMEVRKKAEAA